MVSVGATDDSWGPRSRHRRKGSGAAGQARLRSRLASAGGGVEVGETFEAALARELAEEANVVVEGSPILHGLFHNRRVSRRDHVAVYVVRRFRVIGERAPDREIVAARFFALDALPPDTTRGTRSRLAEVVEGAPISPQW